MRNKKNQYFKTQSFLLGLRTAKMQWWLNFELRVSSLNVRLLYFIWNKNFVIIIASNIMNNSYIKSDEFKVKKSDCFDFAIYYSMHPLWMFLCMSQYMQISMISMRVGNCSFFSKAGNSLQCFYRKFRLFNV